MDIFTYKCTGAEELDGGNAIVYAHPASGMVATNLFVDGTGIMITESNLDQTTGRIKVTGPATRGKLIQLLFKKLPRPVVDTVGFEAIGFDSTGFA